MTQVAEYMYVCIFRMYFNCIVHTSVFKVDLLQGEYFCVLFTKKRKKDNNNIHPDIST